MTEIVNAIVDTHLFYFVYGLVCGIYLMGRRWEA